MFQKKTNKIFLLVFLLCIFLGTSYLYINNHNYKYISDNGVWSWFSDPRAIYFEGLEKKVYTGWVDDEGNIWVASYNVETREINRSIVHKNLEKDDHDNPSILVRSDGRLLVFYSKHSLANSPIIMRMSDMPEDIAHWGPEQYLDLNDSENYTSGLRDSYCYTNPYQLSAEDGKIYLFWRGLGHKPNMAESLDQGATWSKGKIFFVPVDTWGEQRPYFKVASNNVDKIHFALNDGHPKEEEFNNLYYFYYQGGSFYKADGSKITSIDNLPIYSDKADLVYNSYKTGLKSWVFDVAEDKNSWPVIVYAVFESNNKYSYYYSRWDGQGWQNIKITEFSGSIQNIKPSKDRLEKYYTGGVELDHSNPNIIYLSEVVDGTFEIEQWQYNKDLSKVELTRPITINSKNNNIRPASVLNYSDESPKILWLEAIRYKDYNNYFTKIRFE